MPGGPLNKYRTADMLETFHRKWSRLDSVQKPRLVIVAASGGGIRAAVWTAAVLEGLERHVSLNEKSKFRDHIRLMTGASGGTQAAALYAADFENPARDHPEGRRLSDLLGEDSLWPTVQTMLFRDLSAVFWPGHLWWDRGRSLEEAWADNTRPWVGPRPGRVRRVLNSLRGVDPPRSPFEKTFKELKELEAACSRPSVIFSPMLVEDCRRLLISNLDLSDLTTATCAELNTALEGVPAGRQSVSAVELWRLFPDAYEKFTVKTAAQMAATFPFVGPAVSLPTTPPRRVVDAGYYDNFGVNLAAAWVNAHQEVLKKHTSGVVIVEIRAYPRRMEKLRFRSGLPGPIELFAWALAEVSTPAEAVTNLYARGAYFRNDQSFQILDAALNTTPETDPTNKTGPPKKKFFTTVTFECQHTAALSWTLPARERAEICEEFHRVDIQAAVEALAAWFGDGGTPPPSPNQPVMHVAGP